MVSSEWGAPNTFEPGFKLEDVEGRQVRPAGSTSGTGAARRSQQTIDLGEQGLIPLEVRFHHDPERRTASSARRSPASMWHLAPQNGGVGGREGHRGRAGRARGLAVPGAGPDHRPGAVDGRPLPVLLQLAARRHAPVRHHRPGAARS